MSFLFGPPAWASSSTATVNGIKASTTCTPNIWSNSKAPFSFSNWKNGLKETEKDLKRQISFLRGFVVAFPIDIQLKPNNGPCISAHKIVLVTRSKIFKSMLDPDGFKAPPSDVDTLTLSEFNTEELKSFLEVIYTGNLPLDRLEKHVYSLFVAADKYEISYLKELCERYMLNSLNTSNAFNILELSDAYSSGTLKETTLHFIVRNMVDILFSTEEYAKFASINPHLSMQIKGAFANAKCHGSPKYYFQGTDTVEDLKRQISILSEYFIAFKEQNPTDMLLKPKDGPCIPTYRAILDARSKLCKSAAHSNGFKAPPRDSEIVNLSDLNSEEVMLLVEFLYTGKFPSDTSVKHLYSLYVAAEKYKIPYLPKLCGRYMVHYLNIWNAIKILELADTYSNKTMKETSLNFIVENMKAIVFTKEYEDFARANPDLSVQITRAFSTKAAC